MEELKAAVTELQAAEAEYARCASNQEDADRLLQSARYSVRTAATRAETARAWLLDVSRKTAV